ncbi:hypothetical protein KAFR_0F01290 [Kazachstania africana CBS 2517]|uniref:DNA polymerase delta subunit 3 n=1 Tax=Kazachstania africana (strain ATCC 22294 / BCRC 22015 / CBS 2517 / CECT 1963 / NBRC 1671 / NRRL Y-8276) TaxID=1071382 RepID=H2AWH5_KAZAF|nr:hypothetical protein KAFR_0F01290 [Kazachstania africana CBS 2517]CCF58725.1 hypothetical protein KAFR_0F01290 [Kazachstania africana CBS 2517]
MDEEKVIEYINERLFTEVKPVLFTDLISYFNCGPSAAKRHLYTYYKKTTTAKFNCVLMVCYNDDTIKMLHDINDIGDQEAVTDCFIYALNPMEQFNPAMTSSYKYDQLIIRNPNKVVTSDTEMKRAKTLEEKTTGKPVKPSVRAKTVPEVKEEPKQEAKKPNKKEMGLRSTAILAKMRKEREEKEAARQAELRRRKLKAEERVNSDPKRKAQMEELNQLFVNDEDDDELLDSDTNNNNNNSVEAPPVKEAVEPTKQNELEDLLDTTVDDSLMDLPDSVPATSPETNGTLQEKPSEDSEPSVTTYVDKDGYTVTKLNNTPAQVKSSTPQKRGRPTASSRSSGPAPKKTAAKKKQGSIESFFKRSK